MSNNLQSTSNKALMSLDPQAQANAPILNYSLPQQTSFTTYSTISLVGKAIEIGAQTDTIFTNKALRIPLFAQRIIDGTALTEGIGGQFLAGETTDGEVGGLPIFGGQGVSGNQIAQFNQQAGVNAYSNNNPTPTTPTTTNLNYWQLPQVEGLTVAEVIARARLGYAVRIFQKFGGYGDGFEWVQRPVKKDSAGKLKLVAMPQISIIEEYKTTSFLGNYGAGKTISTQSLFPNEKTKITIKTFRELSTVRAKAENIADSMSKESAAEFESTLENESSQKQASSTETDKEAKIDVKAKLFKVVDVNASASIKQNTKQSRESNMRDLSKSLSKHADKSNSNREIKINSNSEDKSTERDETAIEREYSNPNQSRVLNFVFRELLQEHKVVTYLSDIKVCFSNGHPEFDKVVSIEALDSFLAEYVGDATERAKIKATIQEEYGAMKSATVKRVIAVPEVRNVLDILVADATLRHNVLNALKAKPNYDKGTLAVSDVVDVLEAQLTQASQATLLDSLKANVKQEVVNFLETVQDRYVKGITAQGAPDFDYYTYLSKKRGVEDRYSVKISDGQSNLTEADDRYLHFKVPGVITQVDTIILRTPAVIVDSLLGQGEALDQFALLLQESAVEKSVLENEKLRIENQKAEADKVRMDLENAKLEIENELRTPQGQLEQEKLLAEKARLEKETVAIQALIDAFAHGQVTPADFANALGNIFHPNPPKARWSYNSPTA